MQFNLTRPPYVPQICRQSAIAKTKKAAKGEHPRRPSLWLL
jgi:hypothetical protein